MFRFRAADVGELQRLVIRHDNTGISPDWHLQQVREGGGGKERRQPLTLSCYSFLPFPSALQCVIVLSSIYMNLMPAVAHTILVPCAHPRGKAHTLFLQHTYPSFFNMPKPFPSMHTSSFPCCLLPPMCPD